MSDTMTARDVIESCLNSFGGPTLAERPLAVCAPAVTDAILRALREAGKVVIDAPQADLALDEDGALDSAGGAYVSWWRGQDDVRLDGRYTADELIAIGLHMRAMVAAGEGV